jgi:hypothetical protein
MWASLSVAEDRSIFSPIIHVDAAKGLLVVSVDNAVIAVEGTEAAKPHMSKLPVGGMIDIVVEIRSAQPPLLKTWKVAAGESTCKHFDGTTCK